MPSNLKNASKKAIYKSNVSKLDSLGVSKDVKIMDDGLNAIEEACGEFIQRVLENINKADLVVTGAITDITLEPRDNGIDILAPSHLVYQSRGVSGTERKYNTPHSYKDKMPPVDVIKSWIDQKGIIYRDNEKYSGKEAPFKTLTDDESKQKAAWAIAKTIYREGIEPKNLYENEIPKLVEDIQKLVSDFALQFINQKIDIHPREGGEKRIIT